MLFNSLVYLLFSNSVTLRRDLSILFNRIVIVSLQYSIILHILSLFMCNKGISLHGGLLHITNITQIFQMFIFVISIFILQLPENYDPKRILGPLLFLDYLISCFILLGSFYAAKSSVKQSFLYYFPSSSVFLVFTTKSSFVFISPYHSNLLNLAFSYNLEQRRYYSIGYKNIENNNEKFHPLWITGFISLAERKPLRRRVFYY